MNTCILLAPWEGGVNGPGRRHDREPSALGFCRTPKDWRSPRLDLKPTRVRVFGEIHRGEIHSCGRAGRAGEIWCGRASEHTHTRLSPAETLEARALMAADVGLLGGALSGPEFPMAATQAPFNPPASLIGSPLPGSSTAAGLMLGASAGPQGFLSAVSFGGVVSGTLAIQTNTTGGSHAAFAASLASALENEVSGKPGEVSGSAPASPTEPPVSDRSPAAPAPDSQRQGNYRPQWVLPPS